MKTFAQTLAPNQHSISGFFDRANSDWISVGAICLFIGFVIGSWRSPPRA